MHFPYYMAIFLAIFVKNILTTITVNKVVVRAPKDQDIGLIFDLNVVNTQNDKKEMLEFQVRSDGTCTVNLTCNDLMQNASRIVGGNFGYIEAGACKTVSLIWPTVSLYNRVGYCPIKITSINGKGEEMNIQQVLHFDTRFAILDPEGHSFRKRKEFMDCNNWDLNYYKNCSPVDCEERYFGRRSFYNCTAQRCEEVPRCLPHEMYDVFANECIDVKNFCTEEDMENIRKGKFDNNVMELKCGTTNGPNVVINDFSEDKHDFFGPFSANAEDEAKVIAPRSANMVLTQIERSSKLPYWAKGLVDGLLIVFATISIYVLICFVIFLIVSGISRQSGKSSSNKNSALSSSGNSIPIYTHSSLLSQR